MTKKAREILSDEWKWCRAKKSCFCCQACNERGDCVAAADIRARTFTLYGALVLVYSGKDFLAAFNRIKDEIGGKDIFEWNNAAGRTWEEVHSLLVRLDL